MRPAPLVVLLVLLTLATAPALAHAGGIVSICDEPHLLIALAGGGAVTLTCSGTITLTNTITIAADTTIDGSGRNVTLSGKHVVRPFLVNPGRTLDVAGLNVADGMHSAFGSGLINYGTVTLTRCTFSADSSLYNGGTLSAIDSTFSGNTYNSAISNSGTLNVRNCAFTANTSPYGNGGGVYNDGGTLTVNNSTFSNNSARDGGGAIQNSRGVVDVDDCVFSGNTAGDRDGGAILNGGGKLTVRNCTFLNNYSREGGAIYSWGGWVDPATLTVSGSTFSGNAATGGQTGRGGGIYFEGDGALTVSNSTFSGNSAANQGAGLCFDWYGGQALVINSTFSGNTAVNGAGISGFAGTVVLKNTIVAGNSVGECSGRFTDGGGNLSTFDSMCPGIQGDPMLGPLKNNGGPTWTMALLPGSAAIDAADDAICAASPVNNLDQRGRHRPSGAHCDTGAYELFLPSAWVYLPLLVR